MPYKTDILKIDSPFLDRRTKLLPCQKERMIILSGQGMSQRQLAKIFNVSRRLVQFTIDPDKHKRNLEARKERGGSKIYYDRLTHNEQMKTHRRYKHKILTKIEDHGQD